MPRTSKESDAMQLIEQPSDQASTEADAARAEMKFAVFALEAGLMEVLPSTTGVYPFTMKTSYSSGSEASDD
jgi:hypothetical protein